MFQLMYDCIVSGVDKFRYMGGVDINDRLYKLGDMTVDIKED